MDSTRELLGLFSGLSEISAGKFTIGLLVLFLCLLYWYSVAPYSKLERIGIKHPKPLPFVGNMFLFQKGFFEVQQQMVKKYGRVCGYYFGRRVTIMVADPDMLKQILVKDFSNFVNRMKLNIVSKPMSDSILFLQDAEWKHVRSLLTPTFSAAKMKEMCPLINQVTDILMENLKKYADSGKSFNIHKCYGNFSMDAIASVAFGTQVDSQNNPEDPFVKHAKMFFDFSFFKPIIFLSIIFPFFMHIRNILPYTRQNEMNNFFRRVIKDIIAQRDQQPPNERRQDFLQLMLEARKSTPCTNVENFDMAQYDEWSESPSAQAAATSSSQRSPRKMLTEDNILGQAFIFFVAGYETTGNTLSFASYLLATHPECQATLLQEIDEFWELHNTPDYMNVQQLPYLDMVLAETLRMYPSGVRFGRVCKKDCVVNGQFFPEGTTLEVPVGALHYDPEFWPEPEKFKPERFTAEMKAKRHPFVYLPFGAGPRNCIGMRLAQMETKISLIRILSQYRFETCPETQIPMKVRSVGTLGPRDGLVIKIVPRRV
ncbi:thromboxane-A synthase [Callorhinchus milii]|uniref:Thromboxane-A synthase n=1 Tax=Callorhinchus milii TaxID=7868 RepID=A0A4W3K052_CALMI|nr:thromboxane-A synthase [Callorhinchus milii]|eukprot:gi/632961464/ref/XP_007896771.1/ PREDICTED: thromboxane-A synthase [Callorhinchus milii]